MQTLNHQQTSLDLLKLTRTQLIAIYDQFTEKYLDIVPLDLKHTKIFIVNLLVGLKQAEAEGRLQVKTKPILFEADSIKRIADTIGFEYGEDDPLYMHLIALWNQIDDGQIVQMSIIDRRPE